MKILLPVDGTHLSLHEARFALQLMRNGLQASLLLVNVQEPARSTSWSPRANLN